MYTTTIKKLSEAITQVGYILKGSLRNTIKHKIKGRIKNVIFNSYLNTLKFLLGPALDHLIINLKTILNYIAVQLGVVL